MNSHVFITLILYYYESVLYQSRKCVDTCTHPPYIKEINEDCWACTYMKEINEGC